MSCVLVGVSFFRWGEIDPSGRPLRALWAPIRRPLPQRALADFGCRHSQYRSGGTNMRSGSPSVTHRRCGAFYGRFAGAGAGGGAPRGIGPALLGGPALRLRVDPAAVVLSDVGGGCSRPFWRPPLGPSAPVTATMTATEAEHTAVGVGQGRDAAGDGRSPAHTSVF